ncbi:MAG: hypothetical protein PHE29_14595 [Tissierellia bacterium]|nr:hypothetical protein [Tissierellia bacterium]
MFNRKTIKDLKQRVEVLEYESALNHEAIDLLADEMGFEIGECDHCGALMLTK